MTSDTTSTSSDDGWIPWWLWWGGIGLFSLFLLLFGTYYGLTWKWKADFEEEIRKLKKAGHPHSPQALQKAYKKRSPKQMDYSKWEFPKPLKNVLKKIKSSDKIPFPLENWLDRHPQKRKDIAQRILQLLNKHQSALSAQIEKETVPAKYNFSKAISHDRSHVYERYDESELFFYYTIALIETGKPEAALPVIRTLYSRGNVLRKEAFVTNFILGTDISSRANKAVEVLLSKRNIPEGSLQVFIPESTESMKKDAIFVLEVESVVAAQAMKTYIKTGQPKLSFWKKLSPSWLPRGSLWFTNANLISDTRKLLNLTKKPYYEVKKKINKHVQKTDPSSASYYEYYSNVALSLILPAYENAYREIHDIKAEMELLQLATKAKLRSQNKGTGLTPIPNINDSTDPYSGDPYKVRETESHVILYSVGKNLKDDGGSIEEQNGNDPKDVGVKIKK